VRFRGRKPPKKPQVARRDFVWGRAQNAQAPPLCERLATNVLSSLLSCRPLINVRNRCNTRQPTNADAVYRRHAALLDDEGLVTDKVSPSPKPVALPFSTYEGLTPFPCPICALQLLGVLSYIFTSFCTPRQTPSFTPPPKTSYLSPSDLDAFALATNGAVFDDVTKGEIRTYFDTLEDGEGDAKDGLTFAGFEQMYTLQSENEPAETWKSVVSFLPPPSFMWAFGVLRVSKV
jgi:hypothetical protein